MRLLRYINRLAFPMIRTRMDMERTLRPEGMVLKKLIFLLIICGVSGCSYYYSSDAIYSEIRGVYDTLHFSPSESELIRRNMNFCFSRSGPIKSMYRFKLIFENKGKKEHLILYSGFKYFVYNKKLFSSGISIIPPSVISRMDTNYYFRKEK